MARSLTLHRRRTNLIDLTLPVRPGIASYQFQAASNFDAAFTTFDTVPAGGKASKTALATCSEASGFRGLTRFVFAPSDYSLSDTSPLFIRIAAIPVVGAGGTPTPNAAEAMLMVLPYSGGAPNRPVMLSGTAPGAGTQAGSVEIQLPQQCQNPVIQVNGTADMLVAFEPGGPEFRVPALSVEFTNLEMTYSSVTQIFVRGDGVATTFNAVFAARNNPLG